jgi:hypothetical protein
MSKLADTKTANDQAGAAKRVSTGPILKKSRAALAAGFHSVSPVASSKY